MTFTNSFSVMSGFFGLGSIVLYVFTLAFFNYLVPGKPAFAMMTILIENPNSWLVVALAVIACYYVDNVWSKFQVLIWYRDTIPIDEGFIEKKPQSSTIGGGDEDEKSEKTDDNPDRKRGEKSKNGKLNPKQIMPVNDEGKSLVHRHDRDSEHSIHSGSGPNGLNESRQKLLNNGDKKKQGLQIQV
jgi:hypothetical protein